MNARFLAACGLVLVSSQFCYSQVIFSRRVYRQHGRTYQQLWEWNPASGALRPLTRSSREHIWPMCKDKGRRIQFIRPEELKPADQLWEFNRATGAERMLAAKAPDLAEPVHGKDCTWEARSGPLLACAAEDSLTISRAAKTAGHWTLGSQYDPIESLHWSADGRWLLVETLGKNTSSSSPQSDIHIVDVASRRVIEAGSGLGAAWIPGRDVIFFTTPRDLAPLPWSPNHTAWVERLVTFDVATRKTTPVTKGFSDDLDPVLCPR